MERRRSQEARRHETKPYWEEIGERRRTTRPEKKRHDYQFILFFDFNIIMLNSNKRKAFIFRLFVFSMFAEFDNEDKLKPFWADFRQSIKPYCQNFGRRGDFFFLYYLQSSKFISFLRLSTKFLIFSIKVSTFKIILI